jgi:hypothetical protein
MLVREVRAGMAQHVLSNASHDYRGTNIVKYCHSTSHSVSTICTSSTLLGASLTLFNLQNKPRQWELTNCLFIAETCSRGEVTRPRLKDGTGFLVPSFAGKTFCLSSAWSFGLFQGWDLGPCGMLGKCSTTGLYPSPACFLNRKRRPSTAAWLTHRSWL